VTVRTLADLGQGRGTDRGAAPAAGAAGPSRVAAAAGATVCVAEATGGRWLHVRIDYRSEWFEDEEAARRRHDELSADAGAVDTAAFRARYRLP
jgi:hypothetical protein